MKRVLSAVLLMVMLALVITVSLRIRVKHAWDLSQVKPEDVQVQQENPAKPDLDSLRELGIYPFVSNLPVIMLDSDSHNMAASSTSYGKIAIYDHGEKGNDITGNPNVVLNTEIRLRGVNGDLREKKQYRLKFVEENHRKKHAYPLMGMAENDTWILHGPYDDKSLIRNHLAYSLSRDIMYWAPDSRLCEVFVDGKYEGVYLAAEAVSADRGRLNLSKFGLLSGTCSYIAIREKPDAGELVLRTYAEQSGAAEGPLVLKYPSQPSRAQKKWVQKDLRKFEEALYTESFADPDLGYPKYIDVDNFVDCLIMNELAMNPNAGGSSSYIYKNLEGQMRLSVWDYNHSFDNSKNPKPQDQWIASQSGWFQRLVQDRNFVSRMEARYQELRQGPLSEEALMARIDEAALSLEGAADRNFIRWEEVFDKLMLKGGEWDRNPYSHQEAVNSLKRTVSQRLQFMDTGFTALYAGCVN